MSKIEDLLRSMKASILRFPGLSLASLNAALFVLFVLLSDPFGLFRRDYKNADPIFDVSADGVGTILSGRKGQETRMERDLDGWAVRLDSNLSVPGDTARIEELLEGILSLRKFTLASAKGNSSSEFGLNGDEPILELLDPSGKSMGKIIVGALAPRSAGTYVLDEENRIWLVKENLKLLTGAGKRDHFLTRSLIPEFPSREKVSEIFVSSESRGEEFRLDTNLQGEWILHFSGRDLPASKEEAEKFLEFLKTLRADEVLLDSSEEIKPVPKGQNFQIRIRTQTDLFTVSPIGTTKLGSFVVQRKGIPYKLVFDTWNLERILQKDLSEFLVSPGASTQSF